MNMFQKIQWRARLFREEVANKHIAILFYGLLPQVLRSERLFHAIILRVITTDKVWKKLIRVSSNGDSWIFNFKDIEIEYPKNATCLPLIDQYVEILLPYLNVSDEVKHKVQRVTPGRLREPYEYGGAVLKKGDIILDAGANVGMFSIFAAKKLNDKATIYAFEPMPVPRALLEANLARNNIKSVAVVPCAIGRENATRKFFVGILKASGSAYFTRGRKETVDARQVSCDSFVRERGLPRVDFIKVDIEGMEQEFLMGAKEAIQRFTPRMAIAAYHREGDFDVIEKMLKEFVPRYQIVRTSDKIFAWV